MNIFNQARSLKSVMYWDADLKREEAEEKKREAEIKTKKAIRFLQQLDDILINSLSVDNRIDYWKAEKIKFKNEIDKFKNSEKIKFENEIDKLESEIDKLNNEKNKFKNSYEKIISEWRSDKKSQDEIDEFQIFKIDQISELFLSKIRGPSAASKYKKDFVIRGQRKQLYKELEKVINISMSELFEWNSKQSFYKNQNNYFLKMQPNYSYSKIKSKYLRKQAKLETEYSKRQADYYSKLKAEYSKLEAEYSKRQAQYFSTIDKFKELYQSGDKDSITEYSKQILTKSEYPNFFPKNFEIEYNPDNKILIIEYELPSIDKFPNIKEIKYIASRKELKAFFITNKDLKQRYDDALYKTTLRTVHELFQSDTVSAFDAISFNGWVKTINPATGKNEINCILSIQAKKNDFMDIVLSSVDPKSCFKFLKGVASSELSSLTPVKPILQISREDKRFIDGYSVVNHIDNKTNIAAMNWEDFEHLIRELFEKEFQINGGEVKVTHASRDGGVDAIAFDPDPIRGGKIVIQAKRYTNTVGVSAVRDLYGTVVNEGAMKGILVSTADYGPDAYKFAKDKPLTLLNGSNLLHLLEKHGHHAKIDLREAKKLLAEK